jgi:hypothetical protein
MYAFSASHVKVYASFEEWLAREQSVVAVLLRMLITCLDVWGTLSVKNAVIPML